MKIRKLTLASLLLALSVLLPQAFHLTGIPQSGMVFLPMHIPVLLTGFFLGPWYGLIVGLIAPAISFLLTNMPTTERLPFMIIELAIYGLMSGYLYQTLQFYHQKQSILLSLVIAMICGRISYALSLLIAVRVFHLPVGGPMIAWMATVTGVYGIVIQILIIPTVIYTIEKGGYLYGFSQKCKEDIS